MGCEVIRQIQTRSTRFNWVGDSKCFVLRSDRKPFSVKQMHELHQIKTEYPNRFVEKCRSELAAVDLLKFKDLPEQADLIHGDLIPEPRDRWVIFDTTITPAETGGVLIQSALGCAAYCSANKSPWADYKLCSELYADATRKRTLLGLNCVVGVWVDQMEILPILMQKLRRGHLRITKRDNSSLNKFLALIARGISPQGALIELATRGHLEPGSVGLSQEIQDQIKKAKIAANVCGILRKVKPTIEDSIVPENQRLFDPSEIAGWHLSGRKAGTYPALVTEIVVATNPESVSGSVRFTELTSGHPLAKDFDGKNAIAIQASSDTQFECSSSVNDRSRKGLFVHSGYGGASKTAAKLLWEAERAISLITSPPQSEFSPIPILWGSSSLIEERRLQRKLAANLSLAVPQSSKNT